MTFHAAFERMQSKAGKIHSFRTVTEVAPENRTIV